MRKTFKSGRVKIDIISARTDNGTYTGVYNVQAPSFGISCPVKHDYASESDCMQDMTRKAGRFMQEHTKSCKSPDEREQVEKALVQLRKYYNSFFQTDLFSGRKQQ